MELTPADYVLIGLVIALAVTGLFRGFSGTLAFTAALAAAAVAATVAWSFAPAWRSEVWARGGVTLVATLLAFGIVRILVKKTVNRLLAQPADALFGCLAGALAGVLVVLAWAHSGVCVEYSNLAAEAAKYVR